MSQDEANQIARDAQRLRRSRRALKVALPTAAALGAGAAIAVGSIPGSDGTITGCYASTTGATITASSQQTVVEAPGALRVIDPTLTISGSPAGAPPITSPKECQKEETQITWNQSGPQGPAGPQGAQGSAGPQGPSGQSLGGGTSFGLSDAAGNTFLKLEGIKGEATDKQHKGEIEISSFSWGVSNSSSIGSATGGAGAGKTTFQSFTITKVLDKTSPLLLQAAAAGKHYKEAELIFSRKAGGTQRDFLYIKMESVLISSVHTQGSGKDGVPQESVTFNFQKAEEIYLSGNGKPQATVNLNFNNNAKI
jgi:type VI secretion system secreted protein Hcp